MQRLSVFLFTSILGKNIYDEFDDVLGELKDIYVTTEQGYPRVIGYKVKRDGVTFHYEFRSIVFYSEDNKVKILTRGSKEILPRTYSYLLSRNLLDKKIVDINGKRVVRVDDLRIAENVAIQAAPMLQSMQMSNFNLMRKINSSFIVTLPIFKQCLAQAVLLKRDRKSVV